MCWRTSNSNIFRITEIKDCNYQYQIKNGNYQYEVKVYQIKTLVRSIHLWKLELL
jgi:hypothetical protein